jgi:hypothetical protein
MFKNLPEKSFYKLPTTGETILIKRGEKGYFPQEDLVSRDPDELNELFDVTKAQAEAMFAGSMHGWHVPAANPEMYDENGDFIKEKVEKYD